MNKPIPYKLRDWVDINRLDWLGLSGNSHAIHIIEKNLDKINWNWLSEIPLIITYDYKTMCDRMWKEKGSIAEDLIKYFNEPIRIMNKN